MKALISICTFMLPIVFTKLTANHIFFYEAIHIILKTDFFNRWPKRIPGYGRLHCKKGYSNLLYPWLMG